ncbi:hypothetical protein [Micromonospora sp. LOL_024]|uniref:hypothetical protein n=1 Tax=Micromonospora sp. LOL_024 TaxID=3345412 RepID=UPI003A87B8AA
MPSLAFARPMWPATLRAMRELTRLALAALVLAVGVGGIAAELPTRPTAADLPTVATRVAEPGWMGDQFPAWHEQATITVAPPAGIGRVDAAPATGVATPRTAIAIAAAVVTGPARPVAAPHSTTGEGEPTRRGPPDA